MLIVVASYMSFSFCGVVMIPYLVFEDVANAGMKRRREIGDD
jgi:hypothetical protein